MAAEAAPTAVVTDIAVGGMTCAACVRRVERKLGKLDGVTAEVNLATGRARVSHPAEMTAEELTSAVEAAGYTARLVVVETEGERVAPTEAPAADDARSERERLIITAALSLPVLVLSMAPPLQFDNWQWLCFVLAAPSPPGAPGPSTGGPSAACGTPSRPWTRWCRASLAAARERADDVARTAVLVRSWRWPISYGPAATARGPAAPPPYPYRLTEPGVTPPCDLTGIVPAKLISPSSPQGSTRS